MKVEHIGIAVKSLKDADKLFEELLGIAPYKQEKVESESVTTSFFQLGESKIELLESDKEDSAIGKFIARKGEGIHHIAFEVEDIYAEMERLRGLGYRLLNEEPKKGADNKMICFIHPKDCSGVLVELCQEIK
ncbi:MAG: methylmalonyl-CoA epimerase [Bacteroidia bacterium]|nr:methylmalonyl-CoA epimerase [Bacteroidia bacterium]